MTVVANSGQNNTRISDAERSGVKSLPALVIDNYPFNINFGAAIKDLKS